MKPKKKLNRFMSILFAVVMLFTVLPAWTIPVQAAPVKGTAAVSDSSVTKIADDEKSNPAFAFKISPGDSSRIIPFNDVDENEDLTVANGQYQRGWHPTDDRYSGKIGCKINNVGSYRGNQVDVKMTFSWNHLSSFDGEDICPFIGVKISNNTIDVVRLTRTVSIKYELFYSGSNYSEPIPLNMALKFNDIDGYEIYSFHPGDGTVTDVQCIPECEVLYAQTGSRYWMESGTPEGILHEDIKEDSFRFELEDVSYFTVTYNGADADSMTGYGEYTPRNISAISQTTIEKYRSATDSHWETYCNSNEKTTEYEEAKVYLFEHPAHMALSAGTWNGYDMGQPIKTVSDSDETDVEENHLIKDSETYTYNILQMVPEQPEGAYYDSLVLTDVLPKNDSCHAEYISSKVYDGNGADVTSKFDITASGQKLTCAANPDELKKSSFYGTEYRWEIIVKFRIDDPSLNEYVLENSATISTDRHGVQEDLSSSNTVTTKYEQVPLTIEKVWSDAENQDGLRPESIDMNLKLQWLAGGQVTRTDDVMTVTLSDKNNWKKDIMVWNPESYVSGDGEPEYTFKYVWEESNVPDGYKTSQSTDDSKTIVTNTHIPEKISLNVKKVWNDGDDADGLRPDVLDVDLKADGESVRTVTLSEKNEWAASVADLPKYSNGTQIRYTWEEKSVDGYTTEYSTDGTATTITNSHSPELTQMTVKKVWDDNNDGDGLRPASVKVSLMADGECMETYTLSNKNDWTVTADNLTKNRYGEPIEYVWEETEIPEGYVALYDADGTVTTVTNRHEHEKTAVTVQKRWDDSSNADGLRPASVDVGLYADGECIQTITLSDKNNWKAVIDNLPMNRNGEKIEYTVKEQTQVEGYTTETVQSGSLFTITNTHVQETRDIKVTLTWEDDSNRDGIRPDEVTVTLQADGETIETIVLNKDNDEQMTVKDLPKNKDGVPIKYTFVQKDVDGYTVTYDVTDKQTDITDTHIPEKVSVSVQKIWKDSGHEDARPDSLTVSLYINGEKSDKTVTLSEKNEWKGSIDGLYRYEGGKEQTYAFREDDIPEGYTSKAETDGLNTIITNTFKQVNEPEQPEETTTPAPVQPNTSVTSPKTGYDFTFPFILLTLAGLGSAMSFIKFRKIDQKK